MKISNIVPAKSGDYEALYGAPPPSSLQAYVIRQDERPVAIGGLYYQHGHHVIFSDMKCPVSKRDIVRMCHKVMELAAKKRTTIFGVRGKLPTSINLLKHFGFEFVMDTPQGEMFRWNSPN